MHLPAAADMCIIASMLLSAIITLTPLDETAAHTNARQVQRWFKDAFEALDPALFAQLHEPTTSRAYTLSKVYPAHNSYPDKHFKKSQEWRNVPFPFGNKYYPEGSDRYIAYSRKED